MESLSGDQLADIYRNEGNQDYLRKKFFKALSSYNKSLCHAESKQTFGLAYANRSAVYLETKRIKECLENIKLARDHGYPNLKKLSEREAKCKELIAENLTDPYEEAREFFKLSYPPNKKVPYIANCLEVKENEKFGRYIVTNRDLKPGDIVAIEEPFLKYLKRDFTFVRCTYCLKANNLNLIPSKCKCTFSKF